MYNSITNKILVNVNHSFGFKEQTDITIDKKNQTIPCNIMTKYASVF